MDAGMLAFGCIVCLVVSQFGSTTLFFLRRCALKIGKNNEVDGFERGGRLRKML